SQPPPPPQGRESDALRPDTPRRVPLASAAPVQLLLAAVGARGVMTVISRTLTHNCVCSCLHFPTCLRQVSLPSIETRSSLLSKLQASALRPHEVQGTNTV